MEGEGNKLFNKQKDKEKEDLKKLSVFLFENGSVTISKPVVTSSKTVVAILKPIVTFFKTVVAILKSVVTIFKTVVAIFKTTSRHSQNN